MSSRFQWTQTLETFIRQRLGDRTGVGSPKILTNSQYVIDGIVIAVNDHPERYSESHVAIVNCIEHYAKELMGVMATGGERPAKPAASAALSLYMAWCVLDAICKGCVISELHRLFCSSLPSLVAAFMPIYAPPAADGTYEGNTQSRLREATEEYAPLYWAMVRSWMAGAVFPQTVLDQCSDALEQHIQNSHLAYLDAHAGQQGELVAEDSWSGGLSSTLLLGGEDSQGSTVARLLSGQGASAMVAAVSPSGAAAISSMLSEYYNPRAQRDAHICLECGVLMATADALREHKLSHRYMLAEPNKHLRRLLAPSVSGYANFAGNHNSGAFARIAVPQTDVTSADAARVRPPRG